MQRTNIDVHKKPAGWMATIYRGQVLFRISCLGGSSCEHGGEASGPTVPLLTFA
jgi:hypothetical protein